MNSATVRGRLELKILIPVLLVIAVSMGALGVLSFRETRIRLESDIIPDFVQAIAGDAKGSVEATIASAIETSFVLSEDATIIE